MAHRYSYLPNLLSCLRIVLAPAILAAAVSNSPVGFWLLFGLTLISDVADGRIARRLQAETTLGARLDRWGDGLTLVAAAFAIQFLWPSQIEAEWTWSLIALAGYLLIGVRRALLPKDAASRPAWYSAAVGWFVPLSLIPLLVFGNPWPFRYAAVVHWIVAGVKVLAPLTAVKPRATVRPTQRLSLKIPHRQPVGHR